MIWWAKVLWDYRKAALWGLIVITVALMGWRVSEWRQAFKELDGVKAELVSERACSLDSECHKRAATLAEQARKEADMAAQAALEAMREREAKARADASAWRRRYEAALRDEPECADWAAAAIRCPL